MRAALRGNEDVVRFLLKAGADRSLRSSKNNRTAEELAAGKGHGGVVKLLRTRMRATKQNVKVS